MEESNASLLLTPAPKKNCHFVREFPFPILRDENAAGPCDQEWKYIIGHLQEDCVGVYDDEDIKLLFTKGFFGVGSLSKKVPRVCCSTRKNHDFRNQRKQQQQPSTSSFANEASSKNQNEDEDIEVVNCEDDEDEKSAHRKEGNEIEVLLSDSGDSMSENGIAEIDENDSDSKSEEKEHLILTFEEAYFLSYGLGCLVVKDRGQPMDLLRLWNKFCELSVGQNFPIMYTAYHHFRSKGWVVRSGLKYGTDYVLYKDGPPFYHSTYSVLVKPVKEQNFKDAYAGGKPHFTWSSLSALNRITTNAGKGLLLLYVIKPSALSENKVSTPYCISQYRLEEVLFKRWVPSESREEEELA